MATNIKTVMTYPLDGSTTDFNIPFEYLARKFVQVTLIGVDRKVLVLNQDYRFATKAIISTTKAWGPGDGYQQIEIRRYTSATERLVDFTDGSILRAYDLNISQIQTLHVAEEARDLTADTIGVNNDGNLDARGRKIVNLADGSDDGDAISVGQVKRMNQNSWQARNEAKGFRDEAEQFRNQAEGFKNETNVNATNTSRWRNEAEQFRNQAADSQAAAKASQDAATVSAGQASQSKDQAAASAATAKTEADRSKTEADRAKTEADKLGNMNAFAATIDKVEGVNVTFKGNLVTPGNIAGGGLVSTGHANIAKGLSVGENIVATSGDITTRDLYAQRNLTVTGVSYLQGGINQTASVNVYNGFMRAHFRSGPLYVGNNQGLHLAWNEQGSGESNFITNRGAGNGGFVFRTVDINNSVETGRMSISGNGSVNAAMYTAANGARIESNNNIVGENIYAGMGKAYLAGDGNMYGSMWGGWLSNWLRSAINLAQVPGGCQMFTGRGGDYFAATVDGTSVGVRWFSSDRRLKEDIKVLRSADDMLDIIRSYTPVTYKYKDRTYVDSRGVEQTIVGKRSRAGFITQDIIRKWPEAVDILPDGTQSPDPNQIIGGMMMLIKNLDARVQELERKEKE